MYPDVNLPNASSNAHAVLEQVIFTSDIWNYCRVKAHLFRTALMIMYLNDDLFYNFTCGFSTGVGKTC